ncbi:hypothetical protein CFN78_22730 [Amycolatopsis antarctica]|uniref:Uncharacterized protein n=2 Tax=Amycolatopsis antarctica TaxID=1854586 RepID=A0A263CY08_9PSEU|nr:hypothetical protein CFN78_22730 [Amycolatopsis antarctica]
MLRVVLGFSLLTTTLHYAHNVAAVDQYPQMEGLSLGLTQVLVAIGWILSTTAGIAGYRAYVRARYWPARGLLMAHSLAGLASLGHFLVGVPQIPAFWFATIYTDTLAAVAMWVFVVWSAVMLGDGSRAGGAGISPAR